MHSSLHPRWSFLVSVCLLFVVLPDLSSQSANIPVGSSATLRVVANGEEPFINFQWYRNGTAIPGATRSTFTIASAQRSDTGLYSAEIGNALGLAESEAADIFVGSPPFLTQQPTPAVTETVFNPVTLSEIGRAHV